MVKEKYRIYGRKRVEVNTDPQRRCYNGYHFSSKNVWTEWVHMGTLFSEKEAKEYVQLCTKLNPKNHQYKFNKETE